MCEKDSLVGGGFMFGNACTNLKKKKTLYPWIEIVENDFPMWSPRALSSFLPFQAFPFFKKNFFLFVFMWTILKIFF